MNMNRKFAFCAMAAVVLSACSDGNLSSTEALGENWPADFSVSEYAEVNLTLPITRLSLPLAKSTMV